MLSIKKLSQELWNTTTDGCTGVPDGNYCQACHRHDFRYRNGTVSRAEADALLREDVRERGHPFLGWIFWVGVRLFGGRHYQWSARRVYLDRRRRDDEHSRTLHRRQKQ